MSEIRQTFGAISAPPAPLYVAWLESDEMFYVLSDTDANLEHGPYCDKWKARRAALALSTDTGAGGDHGR